MNICKQLIFFLTAIKSGKVIGSMMKRLLPLVVACLFFSSCKINICSHEECIKADIFFNPPVDFRSAPFFSLDDKLDTAEMIRHINGFKEAGYGGFFLHSRGGLLAEYMGKEWWDNIDVAVRTSKQIGLKSWFYDEDRWPSGFGGGKVAPLDEKFRARCLSRIDKNDKISINDQVLFEDDQFKYVCHVASLGDPDFNGGSYVDLMNPEMVKAFINCAYKPYLERYKTELGKTAPGIFTDEPQLAPVMSNGKPGSVSFSPIMLDKFKEMHGYALLPKMPSLFDTIGDFKKIRYDYYQTLSRCFEESFAKQIGEYCAKSNAIFTGHLQGEERFRATMVNSGNSMINYRHMQMPGMDQLGLLFLPLNTPKSVASVANQYGLKRRLSESYGTSGQNMNFEDRKWLLDWFTINGINFIVPHLSLYSMKGERKRDYPPNFSPAQPYCPYNKQFEEYTGRMCYVNTIGKYASDIVLIHPLESAYLGIKNDCNWKYDQCINMLQNNHRNYDLGDEQIIADIAKIKNRKFELGEMSYKVVVLPYMLVIRRSTINLLKQFKAAGGVILIYGKYPEWVNGKRNPEAIDSLKQIGQLVKESEFLTELNKVLTPDYKVEGLNNELIWTHYRKVSGGGILQLSNTSRLKDVDCDLSFLPSVNNLALWNPENGHSMKLVLGDNGKIKLHFAATTSWLVTFGKASKEASLNDLYQVPVPKKEVLKIAGPWKGERLDPNAMTFDFARYSTDNGKTYSDPEPVIGIHLRLVRKKYSGSLFLKFEIEITDIPAQCSLVVEQPQLYRFSINGKELKFGGKEFYKERTFRIQDISGTLKQGINEILLSVNFVAPEYESSSAANRYGTEIESIYLIGNFAVTSTPSDLPIMESLKYRDKTLVEKPVHCMKSFAIAKEKITFENDLVIQGYPFYAGAFKLSNSFMLENISIKNKYFLTLPSFEAIVVIVKVNGKEFPPLVYSPWECEISDALKEGENHIEITLINSLRNLLGPHHHPDGELKEVGPSSFTGGPGWPNKGGESNWYDLRLNGQQKFWRDDYCIIPFGLLKPVVISVENT